MRGSREHAEIARRVTRRTGTGRFSAVGTQGSSVSRQVSAVERWSTVCDRVWASAGGAGGGVAGAGGGGRGRRANSGARARRCVQAAAGGVGSSAISQSHVACFALPRNTRHDSFPAYYPPSAGYRRGTNRGACGARRARRAARAHAGGGAARRALLTKPSRLSIKAGGKPGLRLPPLRAWCAACRRRPSVRTPAPCGTWQVEGATLW